MRLERTDMIHSVFFCDPEVERLIKMVGPEGHTNSILKRYVSIQHVKEDHGVPTRQ